MYLYWMTFMSFGFPWELEGLSSDLALHLRKRRGLEKFLREWSEVMQQRRRDREF